LVESLFVGAIVRLGGPGGEPAARAYVRLAEAYEGRAYHNLRHLEAVLETYLLIADGLSTEVESLITLSLCYHDAVYNPRAKDNETLSADFSDRELALLRISDEDRAEIRRLILLTQHHTVESGDISGAIIVDADLAILQSSPTEYDRYALAIREEYAWVPDAEYRAGRTTVLEGLLAKKLFTSPLLDEEVAKTNMRREIEALRT